MSNNRWLSIFVCVLVLVSICLTIVLNKQSTFNKYQISGKENTTVVTENNPISQDKQKNTTFGDEGCKVKLSGDTVSFPSSLSKLIEEGVRVMGSYSFDGYGNYNIISEEEAKSDIDLLCEMYDGFYISKNGNLYELFMNEDVVSGTKIYKASSVGKDINNLEIAGLTLDMSINEIWEKLGSDYYYVDQNKLVPEHDPSITYVWPITPIGVIAVHTTDDKVDSISVNEHVNKHWYSPANFVYSYYNSINTKVYEKIDSNGYLSQEDYDKLCLFTDSLISAYSTYDLDGMLDLVRWKEKYNDEYARTEIWNIELFPYEDIVSYHFTVSPEENDKYQYRLQGYLLAKKSDSKEIISYDYVDILLYSPEDPNNDNRWTIDSIN